MVIEFLHVRSELKESYDREMLEEMGQTLPFENQDDYVTTMSMNIKDVVLFCAGHIYYNDQRLDCVYVVTKDTSNIALLCKYKDFKLLYELVHKIEIPNIKDAIEKLKLVSHDN